MPSTPSPQLPTAPEFQLGQILKKRLEGARGYAALARAISKANGVDTRARPGGRRAKDSIDRRKLKDLIEGNQDVVLSVRELRAIDAFLEQYGQGLAWVPLFKRPDILRALADSGHVTSVLGSRRDETGWNYSSWDVLAVAEIQSGINASGANVRFDIQDALLHEQGKDALASIEEEGGIAELLKDHGPSIVCVGSTRAVHAAEAMLCRMFECPAFEDAPLAVKLKLPFHFVWGETLPYVFESHFRLRAHEIRERDREVAALIAAGTTSAIVTPTDLLVDRVVGDVREICGVCVAQKRRGGQVWLLLAGVTGAATFAAARLAKVLSTDLQKEQSGQHSPVYWAAFKARVEPGIRRPPGRHEEFPREPTFLGPYQWIPAAP